MTEQDELLQKMKQNFQELIQPSQLLQLDEHIPIFNDQIQPIGYFNHRCYEELHELLKKMNKCSHTPIGLS